MRKIWYTDVKMRSPHGARYHQRQTPKQGQIGTTLGCKVCVNRKEAVKQVTLYSMEKEDGDKFLLCGVHYVEVAKMLQEKERLTKKNESR